MKGIIFLTWRYLKPKKSISSIVTWLSCLGPMLGVGVLLVVTSVMNGFPKAIQKKIMEVESHISVMKYDDSSFDDFLPTVEYIEKNYGYKCSPFTQLPIFIQREDEIKPFLAKGFLPEYEQEASSISKYILKDDPSQKHYSLEPNEIIISERLANSMGIRPGDELVIHSPQKYGKMLLQKNEGEVNDVKLNAAKKLRVSAIFNTGYTDIDKNVLFMHLDTANDFLELEWGAAQGIDVSVPDPELALENAKEMANDSHFSKLKTQFLPWQFKKQQFFEIVKKEKTMMMLVLFFIVGGAAVGVAACLFSLVLQKTHEIGVLKAVGVSPLSILSIFLIQGLVLGILGSTLGLLGGLFTLNNRQKVVEILGNWNPDFYFLDEVPMLILPSDVNLIFFGSIIICSVASLFPALVAISVNPVRALHSNE